MNRIIKKGQNYLLLHHPLIWNTRIIPMLAVAFAMHLLNFVVGYYSGLERQISFQILQILLLVIILVVWFIQYGRQNAFLSFYKKSKHALFYEWLQTAITLMAMLSYNSSFNLGNQLGLRATYSKTEILEIGKTLDQAYFFINDKNEKDFNKLYFRDDYIEPNREHDTVENVYYRDRKYRMNSIINRVKYISFDPIGTENFREKDNVSNELININHYKNEQDVVRNWLYENKKDSVKDMMKKVFVLLKKTDLIHKTNLTVDKWLAISYQYPDFKAKAPILNSEYLYNESDYKYNLPFNELESTYQKYYLAHKLTLFSQSNMLFIAYLVLAFSLLIFSFRISALNDWIMSLVYALLLGIGGFVFGLFTSTYIDNAVIPFCYLAIVFGFASIYFIKTYYEKGTKKLSTRALNLMLWGFPTLFPALWIINGKDYFFEHYITNGEILILNFGITFIYLFFICIYIKKWKGIAEQ